MSAVNPPPPARSSPPPRARTPWWFWGSLFFCVEEWYHVIYNLEEGYVHSDYVEFKERENVELGDGIITETKVNLRTGPSTENDIVCAMLEDETAQIIGFNCGWFKVIFNDQTGYIRSDLMDLTEKPLTNSDGYGFGSITSSDGTLQSDAVVAGDSGVTYTTPPAAPTQPDGFTAATVSSGNLTADFPGRICQDAAGQPLRLRRQLPQRV